MAAGGEEEEASSSFRWTDAARYAVASVVTILMVVVVVKAKMVLRPKSLYLSVPGGSVFVSRGTRLQPEAAFLDFDFSIRAQNPSRRVSLCFVNVTSYFFDNSVISVGSSSEPESDSMFYFLLWDMFLPANSDQLLSDVRIRVSRESLEAPYFDRLHERSDIIIDVTLRLDGWLSTTSSDCKSAAGDPGRRTIFYCRPLLIVVGNRDFDASINKQEAFCVSSGKTRGAN